MLDSVAQGWSKPTISFVKMVTADLGLKSPLSMDNPLSPMIQLPPSLFKRILYDSRLERPNAFANASVSAAATTWIPARCWFNLELK